MDKKTIYLTVLITSIVFILQQFFPVIANIVFIIGIVFLALMIVFCIYLILKKTIKNIKIKKVLDDDLNIIQKYFCIQKENSLLSKHGLILYFEEIDFAIMNFYDMKRRLCTTKKRLYDREIERGISIINNKEINMYYKLAIEALDTIFKYYDDNGIRKI